MAARAGAPAGADRPRRAARHRPERARLPGHRPATTWTTCRRRWHATSAGARRRPTRRRVLVRGGGRGASRRWLGQPRRRADHRRAARRRGDEIVEQVLRENESRWESLSEADRERLEAMARAVVSRLLHEPTSRLQRQCRARARSYRYVQPLRELFGLEAALAPARARRPPRSPSSTHAASAAAGDPARHARQRAGAGPGAAGGRATAGRRGARADHDLGDEPPDGSTRRSATSRASSRSSRRRCSPARSTWPCTRPRTCPRELPDGLAIVGVPERADARDALCGAATRSTSCPRAPRWAPPACAAAPQLLALRPDLEVARAARQRRHAAARAGRGRVRRHRARPRRAGPARPRRRGRRRSTPARACPAPGQGCLALEARAGDERGARRRRRSPTAPRSPASTAERAARARRSSATLPHAGRRARRDPEGALSLRAFVGLPDGSQWIRDELEGSATDARRARRRAWRERLLRSRARRAACARPSAGSR